VLKAFSAVRARDERETARWLAENGRFERATDLRETRAREVAPPTAPRPTTARATSDLQRQSRTSSRTSRRRATPAANEEKAEHVATS